MKIQELFSQLRGKESAPNQVLNGEFPLINEISTNNGVSKRGLSNNIFSKNSITVSVNYAQNVFYQPEDFCASVNIIILQNPHLSELSGLYLATLIRKNNQKYNYTHKTSKDRLNNDTILVPVLPDGTPNYPFMENYIRAIEKKVIQRYDKDKLLEIQTTKQVVNTV